MTRALVLGGGGPVGIAWEAGVLAGLAEAGVHLAKADYICGTSAGSFVGSQLAMGRPIGEMAAAILAEADRPRPDPRPIDGRPAQQTAAPNLALLFQKMQEASSGSRDPQEVRKEIGAFALAAQTVDEATFIRGFGRSLSQDQADAWPSATDYACTAVDAETGEFVVWTVESKVGLAKAVASSCSVPGVFPPITINGRRYIDGGMRSATNADLAKGHDLVVILALRLAAMSGSGPTPLDREVETLKADGARVEVVYPDGASQTAFGVNLMDARVRPAACQSGLAQGRALAATMKAVWV
ncbi:MAG TPA: patatin-like phospholipase family protein [Caulobacteraceae bacterium]|nr:patatin-like phospholipase family protein [Caulobacteraceae bacterium]